MNKEIPLEELLKEQKISQRTFDKVKIAKKYIEHKYNIQAAKNFEWNGIINRINSLKLCEKEKQKIKKEIYKQEMIKSRKSREKQSIRDYESIAIIGRGAFGEVHVCREKKTGKIYAIKKIKKNIIVLKNQVIHILNEQFFMSRAKSPWIVELKESFQEDDYLYLVMEYLPGGDLMNLLIKKDILTENEARFYLSELILAIESIHKLDCIHRDIKPDNILIDQNGHIKLSDFGLAKISDKLYDKENEKYTNYINNKKNKKKKEEEKMTHNKNYSCVGTAYYVAPEVLNQKGYEKDIDWWSAGIIFFEMLVGYAPFCSQETNEVCYKVLNWKKFLKIPNYIRISDEAKDLIFKMINNSNSRLGKNGADEIKKHPFFKGIDWNNVKNMKPPFIPILKNEYDTSYFENFEIIEPFYPVTYNNIFKRKDIEYIGYDFKEELFNDNDLNKEYEKAIKSISEKENINLNSSKIPFCNINNNYNSSKNKIKRKEKDIKNRIIVNRDFLPIPLKKASILKKEDKKNKYTNLKAFKIYNVNYNKYKELCLKTNKYNKSSNSSSNSNKNKLNIIQIPVKKSNQKIYYTNKIVNIINSSNSYYNTMITIDDTFNTTNNYTNPNIKTYNCINKINNSYIIKNNNSRNIKNTPSNYLRNKQNNKLKIPSKNNNILSPQSKDNVLIKNFFLNKKYSKDKLISTNTSLRNKSLENKRIGQTIIKSCSYNNMKSPKNFSTSRRNIKKNDFFNIFKRNSYANQQRPKIVYIYKKKK